MLKVNRTNNKLGNVILRDEPSRTMSSSLVKEAQALCTWSSTMARNFAI